VGFVGFLGFLRFLSFFCKKCLQNLKKVIYLCETILALSIFFMKSSTAEQQAYDHLVEELKQHLPPEEQGKITSEQKLKGQLFKVLNHYFETGQYLKICKIFDTLFPSYTHKVLLDEEQTLEQRKNAYEKLLHHIEEQSNFIDRKTILNTLSGKTKAQEKTKNILAICYGNATSFQDYCKILESKQQIIIVAPEILEKTENIATAAPEILEKTKNIETEELSKNIKHKGNAVFIQLKKEFADYKLIPQMMIVLIILAVIVINFVKTPQSKVIEAEVDTLNLYETISEQPAELLKPDSVIINKDSQVVIAGKPNEKSKNENTKKAIQDKQKQETTTLQEGLTATTPNETANKETANIDSVSLEIEAVTLLSQPESVPKLRLAIKNHGTGEYVLTGFDLKVMRTRGATTNTGNEDAANLLKVVNHWEVCIPDEIGTKTYQYSINKLSAYRIKAGAVVLLDLLLYHADEKGNKYQPDSYSMYATIWAGNKAKVVSKMLKFGDKQLIYDGKPVKLQ
jgi:hypothetical protein